jgi:hypothetical protein
LSAFHWLSLQGSERIGEISSSIADGFRSTYEVMEVNRPLRDESFSHKTAIEDYLLPVLAFGVALVVLFTDLIVIGGSLTAEGTPEFTPVYLFRTGLIALSGLLFVTGIVRLRSPREGLLIQNAPQIVSANSGVAFGSVEDRAAGDPIPPTAKRLIVWVILLLSLLFLLLFLHNPRIFNWLCEEGKPVETASALLCFVSSGIHILIFVRLKKASNERSRGCIATSLFFAIILFLIGMEEVSWFQRFLFIDTPDAFMGNKQQELNLHNFATNKFENLYYFTAFMFLIVIPFIKDKTSLFENPRIPSLFIPSRFIIFVSAIIMAHNYDMWNIIFTQFSFFITLFILIHYIWSMRFIERTFLLPILCLVYLLTQVLFLIYGSGFVRNWDVTEYKEFFIPLSLLIYSIETMLLSNKPKCPNMLDRSYSSP